MKIRIAFHLINWPSIAAAIFLILLVAVCGIFQVIR